MLELVAFQEKVLVFVSGSAWVAFIRRSVQPAGHWQSQSFVVRPIAHGHYPPRETMAIPNDQVGKQIEYSKRVPAIAAKMRVSRSRPLPQPLHGQLDVLRLQLAPALDLGPVAVLREVLQVFPAHAL